MMMKLLSMLFAFASAEGVDEGASEVVTDVAATVNTMADMPLMTKGLIVTAGGLAGVFLVLCLFWGTIKLMQKMSK